MPRSLVALLLATAAACATPAGPRPVVWDREACAHCHMLVGDPAYAAQLQTADGESLVFDDPGCLFGYLDDREPKGASIWFHHRTDDRWLRAPEVAFVPARTPMGHGLAAVDPGTPGARGYAEVRP
jgi:copper chaperone NosL